MDDQVRKQIGHLIIRADANTQIGIGHLMRCLALAQAWKEMGGEVDFVTTCCHGQLLRRLRKERFSLHPLTRSYPDAQDWHVTQHLLSNSPTAWLVLDGYHFDSTYQRMVKEAGYSLMVIDDMAVLSHYHADIVLNQNPHARKESYGNREPFTHLMLGAQYVLLRREFLKWQGWKREISETAHRILVSLGGGDPDNVTLRVIYALERIRVRDIEVTVVLGSTNPHLENIQTKVSRLPFVLRLLHSVDDMAQWMAWADVAISAGGTTCWELAFMGVPSVALVLAENQVKVAESLDKAGVAVNLGWFDQIPECEITEIFTSLINDKERRRRMSLSGQQLIDGFGTSRVVEEIKARLAIAGH